jgi:hypothetical protein
MIRKTMLTATLLALVVATASPQDKRVEIGATARWTFSAGVGGASAVIVPSVGTFDRIDPKDAFSWGIRLNFMVSENQFELAREVTLRF